MIIQHFTSSLTQTPRFHGPRGFCPTSYVIGCSPVRAPISDQILTNILKWAFQR